MSFAGRTGHGESVTDAHLLEDLHAECELAPWELGARQRLKMKCFAVWLTLRAPGHCALLCPLVVALSQGSISIDFQNKHKTHLKTLPSLKILNHPKKPYLPSFIPRVF